jgi:hypothetical protein
MDLVRGEGRGEGRGICKRWGSWWGRASNVCALRQGDEERGRGKAGTERDVRELILFFSRRAAHATVSGARR